MKLLVKVSVLLMIVSGCIKINETKPINSDIEIGMREILGEGERQLEFYCKTTEIYSCMNFPINSRSSVKPGSISIRFKNVIDQEICATGLGPATTTINLGSLKQDVYVLNINVADSRNSGHLIVNSGQYIIEIEEKNQLLINGPVLNRIPDNAIWGTIGYHQVSTEQLVIEFIAALQEAGVIFASYLPGNYGHFRINNGGFIEPPKNHGYYFIYPFVFEYEDDAQDLKNIVKCFGNNYGDKMLITLYTSHGETFTSWMQ